ncbi:MAG: class I SAM-dependent methyltransferase [Bacillus sp. (in: Bacteria)]|nr:class I SAM-dependent methyltransferase [Bacillus sp. (in: firmicutes)]
MFKQLQMVWEARSWMKRNQPFLGTWHVYVGYKLSLFDTFSDGRTLEDATSSMDCNENLLKSWVDAGVVLGHLKRDKRNRIFAKKRMIKYFSKTSPYCIGELVKEMLEMHIPALLSYPKLMKGEARNVYNHEEYGQTVAATSALIEKKALPTVEKYVKGQAVSSVLDIGCGTGGYLVNLARKGQAGKYIGIDLNKQVIEEAKELAASQKLENVEFIEADIRDWNVIKEKMDLVMINNLLHYFSQNTRLSLIKRAADYLNEGGMMLIITPLYLEKSGEEFSTAFNSFMNAHENLYPLPHKEELFEIAEQGSLQLIAQKAIVKEGSWYCLVFKKTVE